MKSLYGTEGFSNVDSDGQFIKKDMFISILLLFVFAFLIGVIFYFVANRHTRLYSKIFGRIMKFKTT